MDYRLKINDETLPVKVETTGGEAIRAVIGETAFDVRYTAVGEHQIHLNINGQGINAYVSDLGDGKTIAIRGKTWLVQDADRTESEKSRKKGPGGGPARITPLMPAVVIAVAVAEGDEVVKGQTLVILSAMKMETLLTAPFDGVVKKVNVAQGDKVMPGDILVDIEKSGLNVENDAGAETL